MQCDELSLRERDRVRRSTVVGIFLLVQEEIATRTDQHILSYYRDSGNRTSELVAFGLVVIGALFSLWFLGTLRSRLQAGEPEP